MSKRPFAFAACVLPVLALSCPQALAADGGLFSDDKALLKTIMPDNWRFYGIMEPCKNLRVSRTPYKGHPGFTIQGECSIKNLPDGDSECPSYALAASGTVNNPTSATIRNLTLTLKCDGQ